MVSEIIFCVRDSLLGIFFWRKGSGNRGLASYMGEKGRGSGPELFREQEGVGVMWFFASFLAREIPSMMTNGPRERVILTVRLNCGSSVVFPRIRPEGGGTNRQ